MYIKLFTFILAVSLLFGINPVIASDYQGTVDITCTDFTATGTGALILNRDNTGIGEENIVLQARDGSDRVIFQTSFADPLGAYPAGITGTTAWNSPPDFNPIVFYVISPGGNGFSQEIQTFTGSCVGLPWYGSLSGGKPVAGPPATNLYDGRINNNQLKDVAAPVAIYCTEQDTFAIFTIDSETGTGTEVINHPFSTEPAAENQLLASAAGVSLYLLTTGEYLVHAPNFEGKLYSITWEECDSTTLTHHDR